MRVLVACEWSGTVREAFHARGHDAWSCDILPTEVPGKHFQCDVLELLNGDWKWDLLIAHPPCTYLSNSGVRWLYQNDASGAVVPNTERWKAMYDGAWFFKQMLDAPVPMIAVENPIMHKYAVEVIGRGPDQYIQPYEHGHMETKKTGLWLKGLKPLVPSNNVKEEMLKLSHKEYAKVHYTSPSADRGKIRGQTYEGIAKSMAEQWG